MKLFAISAERILKSTGPHLSALPLHTLHCTDSCTLHACPGQCAAPEHSECVPVIDNSICSYVHVVFCSLPDSKIYFHLCWGQCSCGSWIHSDMYCPSGTHACNSFVMMHANSWSSILAHLMSLLETWQILSLGGLAISCTQTIFTRTWS